MGEWDISPEEKEKWIKENPIPHQKLIEDEKKAKETTSKESSLY
jgi:hypothetical protein